MTILKYFFVLFFISTSLQSMEQDEKKTITITTSDDIEYEIDTKYLSPCETIPLLTNFNTKFNPEENSCIKLSNITSDTLKLIMLFLRYSCLLLQNDKRSEAEKKLVYFYFKKGIDTQEKLYNVLMAANYLGNTRLSDFCTKIWAEKEYTTSKDSFSLPSELSIGIARKMKFSKWLADKVSTWVGKRNTSLLSKTIEEKKSIWSTALSHDGKLLAIGFGGGKITVRDLQNKTIGLIQTGHPNVSALQFGPDDELWSSGQNGIIKVWNIPTCKLSKKYESPLCKAFVFKYILQHNILVTDGDNMNLCIWDLSKNNKNANLEMKNGCGNIWALEVTKNGSFFVSASADGKVWVYNTAKRNPILKLNHSSKVMSAGFNPTNDRLAYGSNRGVVVLYDLATKKQLFCNDKEHTKGVWSILFADENLLCSGAKDSLIKIWDLRTHRCIQTLKGHTESVQDMAIGPQKKLYSASHDETVKIWDIRKLSKPIETIRNELEKNTTVEQVIMLQKAKKSNKPFDMNDKKYSGLFNDFSSKTRKILLENLNIKKSKKSSD